MQFLDIFWLMLWFFLWIIWIWLLIRVFGDIFSSEMSGVSKVLWMLFVLVVPYIGVFVYLITQGEDMARRELDKMKAADRAQREYIRSAAGSGGGVAEELEKLASLKERGVLSESEFQAQKAKLLS